MTLLGPPDAGAPLDAIGPHTVEVGPWRKRLILFQRCAGGFMIFKGLTYWSGLIGMGDGAGASGAGGMDDILIEELELGVRSYNCLKRVGIETIGDLVSKSENELASIPNFGKKSIDEVIETLEARGLSLRED